MKQKTIPIILIYLSLLCIIYSCKKTEDQRLIPQIYWESPSKNIEFKKGESIPVSVFVTFSENIQSITVSLASPESELNIELHKVQVNKLTTKLNFTFIIDSTISESMLQLDASIISDNGTNHFKYPLNISDDSTATPFGLVKILKNEYGKFNVQKLTSSLSSISAPITFDYEYESSVSINKNLYVSTIRAGGLIKINSNMEPSILLENKYNTDPFISSIAAYPFSIYNTSTPNNQIIGFNNNGTETVRADLQMDISEEILLIDDLIYSIERPASGGSFIIANYNKRTGGYISSQNVTRLNAGPHLFDFGNKKQVYFYHNLGDNAQIERFSQNENNISIIDKINGINLDQKPLKISNYEVIIPIQNHLYLFTKDHISSEVFSSNEKIRAVRMNAAKNILAILTNESIILMNYPSFTEISISSSVANVLDIQFMD